MTEDAIFKEQWSLLKKEMAMGDAHLQQRLEQFIFRQYGRAVLAHYIKALSALELSRHFYLRFRRRSRSVTEPILYWTVLAETTIHMTLEGVKDMHPFISLPACARRNLPARHVERLLPSLFEGPGISLLAAGFPQKTHHPE